MGYPSGDEVEKQVKSRYSLVIAVAKRARQLREGAPRLVESKSRNLITIALEEIAAGKVKLVVPSPEELEALAKKTAVVEPRPVETAELLRVSESYEPAEAEEEEGSSEAGSIEAEASEEDPSESPTDLAEPDVMEIIAEADEEPQALAESDEE